MKLVPFFYDSKFKLLWKVGDFDFRILYVILCKQFNITKQEIAKTQKNGGVAEWLKAPVLKTGDPLRGPGVRIPPPPH